jgi:hypothetical protein
VTSRGDGPLRADSLNAYLLGTRVVAVVAVLALVGGILSDVVDDTFWQRHALLAGVAASVLVVMLSAGIFNEAFERRKRRRWSVLAQYVLLGLVRNARLIWIGILEQSGLLPSDTEPSSLVEVGAPIVEDRSQLAPALKELVTNEMRRQALHDRIADSVQRSDEMLGRWAAVMLNSDVYAGVIDRHVELASDVAWLGNILDSSSPPDDLRRSRLARTSAAVQIEGQITDDMLVDRLVLIAQLAEQLDRSTLALALRLVPIDWWQARLGAAAPAEVRVPAPGAK